MQLLIDMFRYFAHVVVGGNPLNEYLGALPWQMEPYLIEMGEAIALMFGW